MSKRWRERSLSEEMKVIDGFEQPIVKGNLHFQICKDGFCKAVKEKIEIPVRVQLTTETANQSLLFADGSRIPTASKTKKKAPAEIKVSLAQPPQARPGETVLLKFELKIAQGSYTYSTTSSVGATTILSLKESKGIELNGDVAADHAPK